MPFVCFFSFLVRDLTHEKHVVFGTFPNQLATFLFEISRGKQNKESDFALRFTA